MRFEATWASPTTNFYATVIAQPVIDTEPTVITRATVIAESTIIAGPTILAQPTIFTWPTIIAESWWSTLRSIGARHLDAETQFTRGRQRRW